MKYLNEILIEWDNTKKQEDELISVSGDDLRIPEYIKCISSETFSENREKISKILKRLQEDFLNVANITTTWDYFDPESPAHPTNWYTFNRANILGGYILDNDYFYTYSKILKGQDKWLDKGKLLFPAELKSNGVGNVLVLQDELYIPDQMVPSGDGKGFLEEDIPVNRADHWDNIVNLYKYLYTNKNILHFHNLLINNAPYYWAQLFAWKEPVKDNEYFVFSVELSNTDHEDYWMSYFVMNYDE